MSMLTDLVYRVKKASRNSLGYFHAKISQTALYNFYYQLLLQLGNSRNVKDMLKLKGELLFDCAEEEKRRG